MPVWLRLTLLVGLGIVAGIDQWRYRSGQPLEGGISFGRIARRVIWAALFVLVVVWPSS